MCIILRYLILFLFLTLEMNISHVKANKKEALEKSNLLNEICLINFNAEMKAAGESPPPEMAKFTCKCFINKFQLSYSIDKAQEYCKNEASKHFTLDS